jgi:hypothetical protein
LKIEWKLLARNKCFLAERTKEPPNSVQDKQSSPIAKEGVAEFISTTKTKFPL